MTPTARLVNLPVGLVVTVLASAPAAHAFQACLLERVNVSSAGSQASPGTFGWDGAISADGRFVTWFSNASNLVPNDSNGTYDVFVRDRLLGITERVSVDSVGAEWFQASGLDAVSLSADGRYVAFTSRCAFDPNDLNSHWDVYVRDRASGQLILASQNTAGVTTDGHSHSPAISADGRFVAFSTSRADLVPSDTNFTMDVFVRDLSTGSTERISLDSSGAEVSAGSSDPTLDPFSVAISADGRFVVFGSQSDQLVAGDHNDCEDVFRRDRLLGTTIRVSVGTSGVESDDRSSHPRMSPDGRWIAFTSRAQTLVPGTQGNDQVYLHDALTGATTIESVGVHGTPGDGWSNWGHVSTDGRYVWFTSLSSNLIPGDTNGWYDVFRRDRVLGATTRITNLGNEGDGNSASRGVSDDGTAVLFASFASNLVPNDTNAVQDMFVSSCGALPYVPYCFGTAGSCPCGNPGGALAGCENSLGTGGGRLTAYGEARLSADTLTLLGTAMPNGPAMFYQGTQRQNGGLGIAFGDGLRCAGGAIVRLAIQWNVAGTSQYPGVGGVPVSTRGQVVTPGGRTYQGWYRNAAPFCTNATFNLTNGIEIDWLP